MKKLVYFLISIICIAGLCACDQQELAGYIVANQPDENDEPESAQIASINAQISSIQASLYALKKMDLELKAGMEALSATQQEAALSKRIDDLTAYVDDELTKQSDWVAATFSTLEQYQITCKEIASIKQGISDLDGTLKGLISDAEASVKSWVNEQLTGYYTIAQMDAKVTALEKSIADGDESQSQELEKLKANLETAKADIKTAYEKAIADAITNNEGKINAKIAADIKTANDALQSQIDALESRISSLEKTVEDLINHIQSISVIPGYNDGSVGISSSTTEICFEIHPASVAEALVNKGKTLFSVSAIYTQTKAASQVSLPVESVKYENGIVSVFVSGNPLSRAFHSGHASASARLCVSSGTIEYASQYFSLYPTNSEAAVAFAYKAWLGQWTIGSTAGDEKPVVITISPKEENSTYNIDGLEGINTKGYQITATGVFEDDGSLSIYRQDFRTWTSSYYGPATDVLVGQAVVGGVTYFFNDGDYLITNITLSSDGRGVMSSGTVKDSENSVYSIVGMRYYWVTSAGAGSYSSGNTPLPNTLIPVL